MKRRSGMIFVTALGIIVILTALALVFANAMRTEALESANRRSQAEADAIELGAEQFVLAQIDAYRADAYTITTEVQTDTIPLPSDGSDKPGYFWILPSDLSQVTGGPVCGITDEASKLNINSTTFVNNIPNLVENLNFTENYDITDVPASISGWTTGGSSASSSNGATSTDYSGLPEPYQIKDGRFETVEELQLVGFPSEIQELLMPELLWGTDTHRNMLMWEYSNGAVGQTSMTQNSLMNNSNPGIFNYLTVYSLPAATGSTTTPINVFTASEPVLESLGISQDQAENIISGREQNAQESGNTATSGGGRVRGRATPSVSQGAQWALSALGAQGAGIAQYLSASSTRYSADIVAVSPDGRAFRRVRIVIDASQYNPLGTSSGSTTPPSVIIYRKDMTAYGWPLEPMISQAQFQKLVSQQQLPTGWLGEQLSSAAPVGQSK
jgi:type II secretory pathway component PulK